MTLTPKKLLSKGQRQARDELLRTASDRPGAFEFIGDAGLSREGWLQLVIRLPTRHLPRVKGGLPVGDAEDVILSILPDYPNTPPLFAVWHERFAGFPNVMQGWRLCVYLDASREWHPAHGMVGALARLWDWFDDAAAGRLDATNALYHPVGGVLHRTPGTPAIVVREPFVPGGRFRTAHLVQRTEHRLDLRWNLGAVEDSCEAAVITLRKPLSYSAGSTYLGLLASMARLGTDELDGVVRFLGSTARRGANGTPLWFVIAVPHQAPVAYHLLVGRISGPAADKLCRTRLPRGDVQIPSEVPIEWCMVSDERPEISTRRDAARPVTAFHGKVVCVMGCGGLGSWIAEFIVRAGASRILLADPAPVSGGLLVRQNFVEGDIGNAKAAALADRLRSIRDDVDVVLDPPRDERELLGQLDVLIDATASASVAHQLDVLLKSSGHHPLTAQVATDVRSGSLGVMSVVAPDVGAGPVAVDEEAKTAVLGDGTLEQFHPLWDHPLPGDELVPTRGCSVPTFHGSAADLAAVAGCLVTLLGGHIGSSQSGTHVFALPHAAGGGGHRFVPSTTAVAA